MSAWTNGFFHKATLTKIGLIEEDAEKYMAKSDKMVQNKKKVVILIQICAVSSTLWNTCPIGNLYISKGNSFFFFFFFEIPNWNLYFLSIIFKKNHRFNSLNVTTVVIMIYFIILIRNFNRSIINETLIYYI